MYDCCKNFFYSFELERVKKISKRKLARQKRKESYVNPITQAMDYKRMMKEENLSQIELARELGISRVRVTQYLNLLKLPKARLDHIMRNGEKQKITERSLRDNTGIPPADI
ncbi:MAG: helix-turn-helix domain-containing protein [Candidatus Omnitrophica bacterium]|nr:helix-turn-helix domain-containing protein [Candidatus Omnitrophota bacterium]